MRKLPLVFTHDWEAKENEIAGLSRHYHTIIVDLVTISNNKLAKAIKKLGATIRTLEMKNVRITNKSFKTILSAMPIMEKILISRCTLEGEAKKKIEASNLKTLKSLVVLRSDCAFFKYFTNTQLKELKMAGHIYEDSEEKNINKFLLTQKSLETLAIKIRQEEVYKILGNLVESDCQFKLKKLAVDFEFWSDDPKADEPFVLFLHQQKETLQTLESKDNFSETVIEEILKNLKLKELSVKVSRFPKLPLFYNSIRPNVHLKTLELDGVDSFCVVGGLLHVYSSIQTLIINNWDASIINNTIVHIANNLQQLRHLTLPTLTAETPEVSIQSLRTLHVDFVDDVTQWQTLVMNNPTIETLSVKWLTNKDSFTYEVIDAITRRLQNLKRVKFGAYFNPTTRMLEMMSRNCESLKVLEIFSSGAVNQLKNPKANCKMNVTYYRREAVDSVFKVKQSIWVEDSGSESEDDVSEDDEDMMSWDDGFTDDDLDDLWDIDGEADADGILFYFNP